MNEMPADFGQRLDAAGLTQARLRAFVNARLPDGVRPITRSDTSRWSTGARRPSPEMWALLAVIERNPHLIEELRK